VIRRIQGRVIMSKRIAFATLCVFIAGCTSTTTPVPHVTPVGPVNINSTYAKIIKDGVGLKLKDPYSAVYESTDAMRLSDGSIAVCGFVNAKNGFGGYNGSAPYFGMISAQWKKFYLISYGDYGAVGKLCREAGILK
jgi:hypothetical protein